MKDLLKQLKLKQYSLPKLLSIGLLTIILLVVIFTVISNLFGPAFSRIGGDSMVSSKYASSRNTLFGGAAYEADYAEPSLSARNIIPSPNSGIIDENAEEFEVKEYNAYIETRNLEKDCQVITNLKQRTDVIFINARTSDNNCYYAFKVKNNTLDEILTIINDLNPRDLNEQVYTIQQIVEDYTSQLDILEKKLASIDETLTNAVSAYDEIASIATSSNDAQSLSQIIDSKIRIIERLTQEKINISTQIEQLNRSKADQLSRIDYTQFSVNITENKYIDSDQIKDSWKFAVKNVVRDINEIAQDLTINLLTLILLIIQYVLYLFIILVVLKYCFKFGKYIWKK